MNKILAFVFLVMLSSLCGKAQQFEWASAGSNLNAGFKASAIDKKGNIIVAGYAFLPFDMYAGASWLHNSAGDSMEIETENKPLLIISYDPSGRINWKREVWRTDGEFIGIDINDKSQVVVLASTDVRGRAYFPELKIAIDEPNQYFLYTLDEQGEPLSVVADTNNIIESPTSFYVTEGNNCVITGDKYTEEDNHRQCCIYILKSNQRLQPVWEKRITNKECHGFFIPSCRADIADNGDIYLCTSLQTGANFGKNFSFTAPVVDSVTQYNPPFEAYLACYSKNGDIKWVKRSGGKSIFHAIKVTGNSVVLGGVALNNAVFFGKKIDTSQDRKMILASFDSRGNIQWATTTPAEKITAIATDQDNNIYAVVNSKTSTILYETDTLRNIFETLVIASYTGNGRFRWVKDSGVPMNSDISPQLKTDGCGNMYVSGEMWFTLKGKLKWFDAAFVKGDGYGSTPFIARLKNTLPNNIAEKITHQKGKCVISPAPWTIYNYPNPFSSTTTIQYKTTYDDNRVSLSVYDISGKFLTTLLDNKSVKAGTYTIPFSAAVIAKGVYIVVLKGTEAVATARMLVL